MDTLLCDAEPEHPSSRRDDGAARDRAAERALALAHVAPHAHAAVIGHRTLPYVLGLMHAGCDGVRSLLPGAAAPDCEHADLAWIVDSADRRDLDHALRAALRRTGPRGRIVVEGSRCRCTGGLAGLCRQAVAAGLGVVAFDHIEGRLLLAPIPADPHGHV